MGITIGNIRGAAGVLSGIGLGLAQGFFQRGDAGEVFGVQGNVIDPARTAVIGVGAVHAGHGNRNEERRGGLGDHLGDLALHKQVQAERQILRLGVAVGVGFRQSRAAAGDCVVLQRVLYDRCVVLQRGLERIDQHVGLEVIILNTVDLLIRRRIAVIDGHTDGGQQRVVVDKAVKDFDVLRAVLRLGIRADVRDLQVGKLHALERVTVGGPVLVQRGQSFGIAKDAFHAVHIADAGGDIGAVPKAVLFGVGQIVFPQVDVAGAGRVDRRLIHRGGEGRDREAADHHEDQQQGKDFFHTV